MDLTAKNRSALDRAFELAKATGAKTTLLHVVATIDGIPFAELRPFYASLESKARSALARHARRFRALGLAVEEVVVLGRPLERILEVAERTAADLIVMSSHTVRSPSARDWGTLSYKVAILCRSPVLLAK